MSLSRRKTEDKIERLLSRRITPEERAEALDLALALRHLNSGTVTGTLYWLYYGAPPLDDDTLGAVIEALDKNEHPQPPPQPPPESKKRSTTAMLGAAKAVAKAARRVEMNEATALFDSFFDES